MRHVLRGDVGVDGELDLHLSGQRHGIVPVLGEGLADEPDVEVESHIRDVTALLTAQEVARTPDLEVLHRDLHARAEVGVLRDRRQAFMRRLRERCLR